MSIGPLAHLARVHLGWDPSARSEAVEPRLDRKIFHQKNICDTHLPNEAMKMFIDFM